MHTEVGVGEEGPRERRGNGWASPLCVEMLACDTCCNCCHLITKCSTVADRKAKGDASHPVLQTRTGHLRSNGTSGFISQAALLLVILLPQHLGS